MGYYQYCTSLFFTFWKYPLEYEYSAAMNRLAGNLCNTCVRHTFGSRLFGLCVAVFGFLATIHDIYRLMTWENDKNKPPRMQRDLQLITDTIAMVVYAVLLLGLLQENAWMLAPWLTLSLISFIILCSNVFHEDQSHVFLLLLTINNMAQILCVLLKFLMHTK